MREVLLSVGGRRRQAMIGRRVAPIVDGLVERAKRQGSLRADVRPVDLPMIQLMVAGVSDQTGQPELWRRYLRLIFDGMRAEPGATDPLPEGGLPADPVAGMEPGA